MRTGLSEFTFQEPSEVKKQLFNPPQLASQRSHRHAVTMWAYQECHRHAVTMWAYQECHRHAVTVWAYQECHRHAVTMWAYQECHRHAVTMWAYQEERGGAGQEGASPATLHVGVGVGGFRGRRFRGDLCVSKPNKDGIPPPPRLKRVSIHRLGEGPRDPRARTLPAALQCRQYLPAAIETHSALRPANWFKFTLRGKTARLSVSKFTASSGSAGTRSQGVKFGFGWEARSWL